MSQPTNRDEYLARFHENMRIEGYGFDVSNAVPCPWCAASEFVTLHPAWGIMVGDDRPNIDKQMTTEQTCKECGRSGLHIVVRSPAGVTAELVQTGGEDAPDWLAPAPRRV